jgi:PPM family protein phosphatase
VLLCSDGLWDPLGDARLAEVLRADVPLDALAVSLCDAALAAGGSDNLTAVLCRVAPAR